MAKFSIQETVGINAAANTVRLGAGTGAANNVTVAEAGKAVKLVAESRFDLCAAGDAIEAYVAAVETPTQDGYSIRSEEHTSELQSQSNLVCRLLLEKKS